MSALTPLPDAVLTRLAWLDLSDVQHRFVAGEAASFHANWNLSVEYRRFVLLRLAYRELDIPAPPLIDLYWRLHAADQERFASDCALLTHDADVSPHDLVPPPRPAERSPGPGVHQLYEATFPCGNADLWGWPPLEPGHRHSAPALGSVHCRLPSAIDESTRARLREEAFTQRQSAARSSSDRMCHASAGPVLTEVHWNGTIPRLITEQTGAIVSPSGAGYLYYRSGDSIGIHTDPYGCELTLLTLLSGAVEPLHCHLHLTDTPLAEIQNLAETTNGLPHGGTPFDISAVPFLLSGQRIPHHRAPLDRENETIVVAQFYAPLLFLRPVAFDQPSRACP